MSNLIPVSYIKIENRIRKDYGDISVLADSIREHGLLQPIVVTPDNVLIAGERRLKAVKSLGWTEIVVEVKTAQDREEQLLCEIAENEDRKQFTPSERVAYGLELEQIEKLKAKENSLANLKQNQSTDVFNRRGRSKPHEGHTDKIVGAKVGMSEAGYFRAKKVVESGNQEVISKMDNKEIGVGTAYEIVKGKRTEDGKPIQQPKQNQAVETNQKDGDIDFSFLAQEHCESEEDEEFNNILNETIADAELMTHFKSALCVPVVAKFLTKSLKEKLSQYPDTLDNSNNEDRKAFVNVFNIFKKIIREGD